MLTYKEVSLELLEKINIGYTYYLFSIVVKNKEVGKLTFRLGSDETFILDGHVGYEIEKEYQGHHYAYKACKALESFMKDYYDHVLITCDPENIPSKKTIEKLNTSYLKNKIIPSRLRDFYPGSISKDIYVWYL